VAATTGPLVTGTAAAGAGAGDGGGGGAPCKYSRIASKAFVASATWTLRGDSDPTFRRCVNSLRAVNDGSSDLADCFAVCASEGELADITKLRNSEKDWLGGAVTAALAGKVPGNGAIITAESAYARMVCFREATAGSALPLRRRDTMVRKLPNSAI